MNKLTVGKYVAQKRNEKNLTQEQLERIQKLEKQKISIGILLIVMGIALLVHVVYIGSRCYVKDWREERGYF